MSSPVSANAYVVAAGTAPSGKVVVSTVNPSTTNLVGDTGPFKIGQRWINSTSNNSFTLTSVTAANGALSANWLQEGGGGSGSLNSLTGDTGTAVPNGSGAIQLTGGSTGLTETASGSTITLGGTLGVANGGTGAATLTAHGVLIGEGTSAVTAAAPSATSGVPVISQGASADPIFGTALIAGGGTGAVSFATFAPVCSGATGTTPLQAIASGSTNSVLQGAGSSAYPFFSQTPTIVKLNLVTGSNQAASSTAAMTAGSVTVNNSIVTSSSFIYCYPRVLGTVTAPQAYYISAIVNGVSFTITSADATDTSTWNYMIVN